MWKYSNRPYLAAFILLSITFLATPLFRPVESAWAEDGGGLRVSPTSLTFTAPAGGTAPPAQHVSVSSGTARNFTVTTSATWLTATPTSGKTPATLTVSANPAHLAPGTYTGSIRVSVPNSETSRHVSVTFTVTASTRHLVVTPGTLAFSYQQAGTLPTAQSLSVRSSTGSAISYTTKASTTSGGSWLSASPGTGTTPGTITVSVHPGSLAVNTYTGAVTITPTTAQSGSPVTVTVTLHITNSATMTVTPSSLAFGFQLNGSQPGSQHLSVSATSAVSFTATASTSSGGPWLTVTPTSGTTPATLTVSANPGSLGVGTYSGSVVVTSSISTVTIPVTLTVTAANASGYVLLAWSELGMHCMDGQDYSIMSVLPPYNGIFAKLLTTGTTPTEVTSGVTLTYVAFKDAAGSINTTSAGSLLSPYATTPNTPSKTNFWTYVKTLVGITVGPDVGLHNYPVQSLTPASMTYGGMNMVLDPSLMVWKAEGIPTEPYDDAMAVNAYPMAKITAKDSNGNVLATATVVLNVSDQMSCANCHAPNTNTNAMPNGGWITSGLGVNTDMRLNILKKHDDRWMSSITQAMLSALQAKGYNYQSSLYATAFNGTAPTNNPVLCAACHKDNALDSAGLSTGIPGVNPLTQDAHTLHASVSLPNNSLTLDQMTDPNGPGGVGCYQCHPGPTVKCQRGAMTGTIPGSTAVSCYGCHGNLSRVGVSTRAGWLDEPSCQMCHQGGTTYTTAFTTTDIGPNGTQRTSSDTTFATQPNAPLTGYSLYRFSTGHGGVNCSGCHGAQHAEYPTNQANDQVYSVNLQGYGGRVTECVTCHTSSFATTPNGGPHGMHTVGSAWVSAHQDYADSHGSTSCQNCHGTDYKGTSLSMILTSKTLNGKTFPAYHQMNCYDCHNGPNGG